MQSHISIIAEEAYQYEKQLHLPPKGQVQQEFLKYFLSDNVILVQVCKVHGNILLLVV